MNHRIFQEVYQRPWCITGGAWLGIHNALQNRKVEPMADGFISDLFIQRKETEIDANGVAHIDVRGILGNLSPAEKECGGTDYGDLADSIVEAANSARAIMLHCDSPGGQASGCIEVAEIVGAVKIPTAAHVSGLGCSACYKILVGADQVTASQSSEVGSIGVIYAFVDRSEQWREMGIKADYITSGDLKGAGYPPSLNDAQRAHLQETVDDLFQIFRSHVLKYRKVSDDSMRGQAFIAQRAKANNLIDRVSTADEAYSALLARVRK